MSRGAGLREWLETLEVGRREVAAAAWDTRLAKPGFLRLLDRAAKGTEQRLRRRGLRSAAKAEHFMVAGPTGPLADGELERATRWGRQLAAVVTATAAHA